MLPYIPDPTPGTATCGCLPPLTLLYNQSNQAWELASVADFSLDGGDDELEECMGGRRGRSYSEQQLQPVWERGEFSMTGG